MKKHKWEDLEVWGERELIEYILELESKIEKLKAGETIFTN